jgi:type I restriction enzyme S subunit
LSTTLRGLRTGAAQPQIIIADLKNYELSVPPLPTQRKIAAVLSAYEDLIENNTRRIEILEEMARAIYREWFVEFRFPGHEDVELVDSELGPIPEGWEASKIGDVLDTIESGSRPKGGIDPDESEVPSIGAGNILGLGKYDYSKDSFISQEYFESMKRGIVNDQDVLIYKDGANLGRKALFRDGFPHEICSINSHVYILRSGEKCTQSYLYFWLDLPKMTSAIKNLNTNAAQPGINQKKVKSLPILIPDQHTISLFERTIEPILKLLFNLAKRNVVLTKTRDILLPKLVSGEVDVSELEIETR